MNALTDVQVSKRRRRGLRFFFILHIVCNDFTQFIISVKLKDSGIFRPQDLSRLKWGTGSPIKYILAESERYCMRLFVTTLVAGRTQCSFTSVWGKMESYKKD